MAFDRHSVDAGHAHDVTRRAGNRDRHLLGADLAARGADADDAIAILDEVGHFAVFQDVDAAAVGAAGITPRNRIMPGSAGAPLHQPTEDREARRARNIDRGHQLLDFGRRHQHRVGVEVAHGVAAPREIVELRGRMA